MCLKLSDSVSFDDNLILKFVSMNIISFIIERVMRPSSRNLIFFTFDSLSFL